MAIIPNLYTKQYRNESCEYAICEITNPQSYCGDLPIWLEKGEVHVLRLAWNTKRCAYNHSRSQNCERYEMICLPQLSVQTMHDYVLTSWCDLESVYLYRRDCHNSTSNFALTVASHLRKLALADQVSRPNEKNISRTSFSSWETLNDIGEDIVMHRGSEMNDNKL